MHYVFVCLFCFMVIKAHRPGLPFSTLIPSSASLCSGGCRSDAVLLRTDEASSVGEVRLGYSILQVNTATHPLH